MSTAFTNSKYGKPPSEMQDLLRGGLQRAVREWFAGKTAEHYEAKLFESLCDSGLLRLLEAGQHVRDCGSWWNEKNGKEWDAALAGMKDKVSR